MKLPNQGSIGWELPEIALVVHPGSKVDYLPFWFEPWHVTRVGQTPDALLFTVKAEQNRD